MELEPGEELRKRIGGELLGFGGNGVIGINSGMSLSENADGSIEIHPQKPSRGGYRWLYTFTVWDKSHFEAAHEQPRKLLKYSLVGTVAIFLAAMITAAVGLIQLAFALGWL